MDGWWNEEEQFYAFDETPEEEEMLPGDDAGTITNPFTPISVADHFEQLAHKPQPQNKAYTPPKPGQLYGQSYTSRTPLTPARPLSGVQQGDPYGYDGGDAAGAFSDAFPPVPQVNPFGYGVGASPFGASTIDDTASFSARTSPVRRSEQAPAAGLPPFAADGAAATFQPADGDQSPYPGFPPLPRSDYGTWQPPAPVPPAAPESEEPPAPALDWSLPAYPEADPDWQPAADSQPGVPDFIKELEKEEEEVSPMDKLQIPAYLRVQPLPRKAPRPAPAAPVQPADEPEQASAQAPEAENAPVVLPIRTPAAKQEPSQPETADAPAAEDSWYTDEVYMRPAAKQDAASTSQPEQPSADAASAAENTQPQADAAPAASTAEAAAPKGEQPRRRRRRSEHSEAAPEPPQPEAASEPATPSQEDARPFVPAVGAEDSPADASAARPISATNDPMPLPEQEAPRNDARLRPAFPELKAPAFPTRQNPAPRYAAAEIDSEDDWRPNQTPANGSKQPWPAFDGSARVYAPSGSFAPPVQNQPYNWSAEQDNEPLYTSARIRFPDDDFPTPAKEAASQWPAAPFYPPVTDDPDPWQPYDGSHEAGTGAGMLYSPEMNTPPPWQPFTDSDEAGGAAHSGMPYSPEMNTPPPWQPFTDSDEAGAAAHSGMPYSPEMNTPPTTTGSDLWSPFADDGADDEATPSTRSAEASEPSPWLLLGDEDNLQKQPAKKPAPADGDDLFADLPPLPGQSKDGSAPKQEGDPLFGTSSYDAGDMPNPSRGNLPYEVVSEYDTLNRQKEPPPAPETTSGSFVPVGSQPKPGELYGRTSTFAKTDPQQPPAPLVLPKKAPSAKPPINPVRLVLLLAAVIMALFCLLAGGKMLLSYVQNTEDWGRTHQAFFDRYGVSMNQAGEMVNLPADGSTFAPTGAPAQSSFQQTNPQNGQLTSGDAQAPTPTPVRRTRLEQYPQNPLRNKLESMVEITDEYPEVVGRLVIPGVLDEWVTKKNNTYYLNHNYRGTSAEGGAVFMDNACTLETPPENLHLRGSDSAPGKTFHTLWQYKTGGMNFVRTAEMAQVTTLYEENDYLLYAVIEASSDPNSPNYFNYSSYPTFSTDEEMMEYLALARQHSIYTLPTDVQPGDRLLTLSTSSEGNCLVLIFRMVR